MLLRCVQDSPITIATQRRCGCGGHPAAAGAGTFDLKKGYGVCIINDTCALRLLCAESCAQAAHERARARATARATTRACRLRDAAHASQTRKQQQKRTLSAGSPTLPDRISSASIGTTAAPGPRHHLHQPCLSSDHSTVTCGCSMTMAAAFPYFYSSMTSPRPDPTRQRTASYCSTCSCRGAPPVHHPTFTCVALHAV